MADCNTPTQPPCGPGPFDSPVCYTVPPALTVLNGFKRVTLNPDCSAATVQILDDALVVVPGAVEAGCDPLAGPTCCDPLSICAIVQTLPLQVPGVGDTALFVTPGGCFLGVPGGGGGGFPGYGIPVTTACANAAGVSLLVARADHVHRSALPVEEEGVLVGTRCSLNFIGDGVTAVDNPGLDRVDVTIPSFTGGTITSPILGANGSCAAPTYSFTASPDSGMFYTGTAVRVSDDNCDDFIEVGASINVHSTSGNITTTAPGGSIAETAGTTWTATAAGAASIIGASVSAVATAGSILLSATADIHLITAATSRLLINALGAWNVSAGGFGVAGQAILSNGPGVPPTWTTITAAAIGANQTITIQDAGAVEVVNPSTLNFNNGFVVTPAGAVATIDLDYGSPVATAQANADGVSTQVARADHVHRTIVQVQDGGALISSRPTVNFIDGTGITVTIVDNGGADRADITIASTSGMTGFATPTVAADAAAATGGVATTAIRSDAKLSIATAAPITVSGTTNSIGVATTIARSDHVHRLGVEVQEEGVLTATRPRLNFIGAAVTVTDDAGGDRANITITAGSAAFIQRFTFQADQFDSPVSGNWAVNALAPAAADSLNSALTVRRFDDTTEEGVGGLVTVPPGAVNVTFYFKWRAQTAPGGAAGVVLTYYTRSIPDNAAVGAWSAAVNFTTLVTATNTNFQYDSETISLATLGWTASTLRQFEITRRGTQAGDTLTGDFNLAEMIMEFTT